MEVDSRVLTRFLTGGDSYLSSGDRRLLFGLGPTVKVGRLTVFCPTGRTQSWEGLGTDCYRRVTAGAKDPQRLHVRPANSANDWSYREWLQSRRLARPPDPEFWPKRQWFTGDGRARR